MKRSKKESKTTYLRNKLHRDLKSDMEDFILWLTEMEKETLLSALLKEAQK